MHSTATFVDRLVQPEETLPAVDIGHDPLPPILRPDAQLGVLDITEWFGSTSGGIRTYLLQKALYVAARPWLRQVLTVPGSRDAITEEDGVRMYRLQGPSFCSINTSTLEASASTLFQINSAMAWTGFARVIFSRKSLCTSTGYE